LIHLHPDNDAQIREAFRFAQSQVKKLIEKHPDFYPMYTQDGKWKHGGPAWTDWCDGFLPGMMWIFHKRAKDLGEDDSYWYDQAVKYSRPLEVRKNDRETQDLGFIFLPTYERWYRITRDPALLEVLVQAGKTLAGRFNETGGFLRSFVAENSIFIDIMMNVGIIFYAARETGDKRLREIAMRHALNTRRVMVRGDGSTAHEGIFDLDTGAFLHQSTQQGYRGDSCWSRGLAWGLYGFTTCYEYSSDPRFLDSAQQIADYYITHTPADGVPPWDYNAPPEKRILVDSSAAAIAAAGLFRLSRVHRDPVKAHFYWETATAIVKSLCDKHLANTDKKWEGILKGGVYHLHNGLGVDESVMWGEYYFVESLARCLRRI
jgi:unsaturated chondroitin disaccharide hydrolase